VSGFSAPKTFRAPFAARCAKRSGFLYFVLCEQRERQIAKVIIAHGTEASNLGYGLPVMNLY
jgi:hypothetical protein